MLHPITHGPHAKTPKPHEALQPQKPIHNLRHQTSGDPRSHRIASTAKSALVGLAGLSQKLAETRAHDGPELKGQEVSQDQEDDRHDGKELDVELDKAASGLPVEGPPSVEEANGTSAAQDLGHHLAGKRAVEGHNRLLVIGKQGGFDADLGHCGGKHNEETGENGNGEDGDGAQCEGGPLGAAVVGKVVLTDVVKAQDHDRALGNVHGDETSGGLDSSREGKLLPAGAGGDALEEASLRRHGDDLVRPGGVQVGSQSTGNSTGEEQTSRYVQKRDEDGAHDGEAEVVGEVAQDTPPARKAAGLGDQVADGTADGRGDGLLVDECDGGAGLDAGFLGVLETGLRGGGHGDGGRGRLDHGENGDDIFQRVLQLLAV